MAARGAGTAGGMACSSLPMLAQPSQGGRDVLLERKLSFLSGKKMQLLGGYFADHLESTEEPGYRHGDVIVEGCHQQWWDKRCCLAMGRA